MKTTITMLSLAILFIALCMTATALPTSAATHNTATAKFGSQAIVSHNPPRIVVTQPATATMSAPPKFGPVLFSGDVQSEVQESVPARFTVTLMCDGGKVSYTLVDLGGVVGKPNMPIEHRTIICDNAPHLLPLYDLPQSDNIAILVDRLTTVTVEVA